MVFSTARDTGFVTSRVHKWTGAHFLNLYQANIKEDGQIDSIVGLSRKINTKTHESSSVFTKDGNTIYFTRNNSKNGSFSRDEEGVSRLKIFKSVYTDGAWSKAASLSINSEDFSVSNPALSADEKTLYFTSDMPGGFGLSDLYKVTINEDGSQELL